MSAPGGFELVEGAGAYAHAVEPIYMRDGVLGVRAEARHLNPAGTVHGGFLAFLVDLSLGRAIQAEEEADRRFATVSLTTDYLGAVSEGDWIEARSEVERLGGRLAFADCSLRVDGKEVVRGRAVFAAAG